METGLVMCACECASACEPDARAGSGRHSGDPGVVI